MIVNRIITLVFLCGCMTIASAQEITRIEYIPSFVVGNVNTSVSHDDRIIEDEGRYCIVEDEDEVRRYIDLDFDDLPHGYVNSVGDTSHRDLDS